MNQKAINRLWKVHKKHDGDMDDDYDFLIALDNYGLEPHLYNPSFIEESEEIIELLINMLEKMGVKIYKYPSLDYGGDLKGFIVDAIPSVLSIKAIRK